MNDFEDHGTDSELIRMKALQLVYDFHALRFPGTHPSMVEVEWYGPDPLLDGREQMPSPESFLDSDANIFQKALLIKSRYRPVMRALMREQVAAGATELIALCAEEIEEGYDAPVLAQPGSNRIEVERILPGRLVLDQMQRDFAVDNGVRCPALEQFIARHAKAA